MNIQSIYLILRAWKWTVLGIALAVIATVTAVSLLLPKKYMATSTVVVDMKTSDPVLGAVGGGQLPAGYLATQTDIIRSQRVTRRVIKTMKLSEVPELRDAWQAATQGRSDFDAWLSDGLIRNLDLAPSRDSSVISIGYLDVDPVRAAAFANAYAQAYLDVNLELKVEPARQYAAWFDERNKTLRAELEAAQKRLSAYQQQHGIVATEERLDIENARLAELSTQLSTVQSLRTDTSSRQRQAGQGETLPEVVQNGLLQSLRQELSRLEAERDQLASRYGANHPEFKRVTAEVAAVRDRLTLETARVASSIGTANRVNQTREAEIRAALEEQKRRVLQLRAQRDEIAVLQRDVESAQSAYELVTQRLAQTSLESQNRQTNVTVLSYATPPLRHSSPRLSVNIVLSVFLGLLLGVGAAFVLEMRNRRVRSESDLADALGVPVLTSLNKLPRRRGMPLLARA